MALLYLVAHEDLDPVAEAAVARYVHGGLLVAVAVVHEPRHILLRPVLLAPGIRSGGQ